MLETLIKIAWRLRQTANVRHFVCYKNKIIYRKMFYLHGLFKTPQTPYRDTLFNYKNLAVDNKWFFCLRSLTFDLSRLTLTFYNWTARQAHSGSLQTW